MVFRRILRGNWHQLFVQGGVVVGVWLSFGMTAGLGQNQTGPKNLLMNPGFERFSTVDSPWYGTTKDGTIRGMQGGLPVLTQAGNIAETPMPVSVAAGDLNGDGLEDLVIGSVNGYLHAFFNQGTKEEPKFGVGELIPVFLGPGRRWQTPRVHLADPAKSGKLDLWIGTYGGDILRIPNTGSSTSPDFRPQPRMESFLVQTTQAGRRWGNVFAPFLWDFNRDGKPDLLIGEGSYSANSIHILLNQGSAASPRFDDENRHVLAYGMGRDQLSPVVVDYDDDGNPDLLVSDSSGQIGLYSSTVEAKEAEVQQDIQLTAQAGGKVAKGGTWNPGEHIPFVKYIESGGRPLKFAGITSLGVCDLNGDGLFDLLVGQSGGQVSWVRNSGQKGAPKFEQPVLLKGEPAPQFTLPTSWGIGLNLERGNFFATATTVTNEEDPNLKAPEGNRALKIFYVPNKNSVIKTSVAYTPTPASDGKLVPPNRFFIELKSIPIELGKKYELTFQTRGSGVTNSVINFIFERAIKQKDEQIVRRAGRQEVIKAEWLTEKAGLVDVPFSPGGSWSTIRNTITVAFKNKDLNDREKGTDGGRLRADLRINFELAAGRGEIYFDDFQLIER